MPRRQLLPGSAAQRCCPPRGDVPSRAPGEKRAKSKRRCGGERGREGEKERESQTESGSTNGISGCPASGDNKQAWSLLAWAGGRGKGQRVSQGATPMSLETVAVSTFPPFFQDKLPSEEVPPAHPCLEISHLKAAPKLQDAGRGVGLSLRAQELQSKDSDWRMGRGAVKGKGSHGVCELQAGRRGVLPTVWILSSGPFADLWLHFLTNSVKRYQTCSSRAP